MKETVTTIKKIIIECVPDDKDKAIQNMTDRGYTFKYQTQRYFYNKPIYFLVGEKPYGPEDDE